VDEEARARLSSVVGIFGYAGIPLTYVSTTRWFSLHPRLKEFSLGPEMNSILVLLIFSILALFFYLLWLDVKVEKLTRIQKGGV
jgi:hypothetical protein